jgi:hypothetical protein
VTGVEVPTESPLSDGPAQARNTASRIEGVNKDKVRCESLSAPKSSKFFCENSACVPAPPSNDRDDISLASKTFPLASTASCGGLANGSNGTSSFSLFSIFAFSSSSSFALYSGHHNLSESL